MKPEIENEEIANTGAAIRSFRGASLLQAVLYKTIKGLPLHVYAQEYPCPAPTYPSGCTGEDQRGSFLPPPVTTPTLTRKILPALLKWAINPRPSNRNSLAKLRYGRKILGADAPSEGTTAIYWAQAKDPDLLFEQHTKSELDFGENRDPEVVYLIECSRLKAEQLRHDYNNAKKSEEFKYNTEAKLKKAMGDDYYPPEISPSRQIETSRETTRGGYTDETVVIKSISEDEKWRKAVLLKFGKKPVDFNFTNGLYMLVERPKKPTRIHLLIDAKDFQAPDERVYIGTDQFKTARAAMAKSTGFAIQSLLKCPSRVLTFEQNGAEIRVTISDCEMFEDENMGKKMSRAKQLEFVQQLTGE